MENLLKEEKKYTFDNRFGKRFPKEKGYYGYLVGDRPARSICEMRQYTFDVYDSNDKYVTTFTAENGEW